MRITGSFLFSLLTALRVCEEVFVHVCVCVCVRVRVRVCVHTSVENAKNKKAIPT